MNGKKIITYLYKEDGEYIESFKSISHFRARYYPNDKSPARPIFDQEESGVEYHYNKTFGVILLKCMLGKRSIAKIVRLHNACKTKVKVSKNKYPNLASDSAKKRCLKENLESYFKLDDLFGKSSSRMRLDAISLYSKILLDRDYNIMRLSKEIKVRPVLIKERLVRTNEKLKSNPEFKKAYIYIKEHNYYVKEDILSIEDIKSMFNIDIRQKTRKYDVLFFRIFYIEQEINRNIDERIIAYDVNLNVAEVRRNALKIDSYKDNNLFTESHKAFTDRNPSIVPNFFTYKRDSRIKQYEVRVNKIRSVGVPIAERLLTGKEISDILRLDMKNKLWNKDVRLFTDKDMKEIYRIRDENLIKI